MVLKKAVESHIRFSGIGLLFSGQSNPMKEERGFIEELLTPGEAFTANYVIFSFMEIHLSWSLQLDECQNLALLFARFSATA